MADIEKDNGLWKKDPSGLTRGNLNAWKDNMFRIHPDPAIGDIVVVSYAKNNKKVGYKCLESNGYDTKWQRVSADNYQEGCGYGYVEGIMVPITPFSRPHITETASGIPCDEQGVYLGDGVYINPEDCWF